MTRRRRDLSASLRRLGRTLTPRGYAALLALVAAAWWLALSTLGVLA